MIAASGMRLARGWRWPGRIGAAVVIGWMLVAAASAPAQDEAEPPRISNVFLDTDLRQALQDLGAQAGVAILADPSVGGLVTAELDDVPLDKALQIILAGTGFVVQRTADYYLVYAPDPKGPAFAQVSETRLLPLSYIDAEMAKKMIATHWNDYVRADPRGGALTVTAPPPILDRIEQAVRLYDQPRRHVMLDARIVVMERNDLLNMGVNWDFPQVVAGAFSDSQVQDSSDPSWPWGVRIGYTPSREFTNALVLTLNLLGENQDASIIARPQVLAQDNKESRISVTTEEYFEILTAGVFTQSQLEKIETGTTLTITPRIGEDGKITLVMQVEVSDVVARGEGNLPVVNRRVATSTVCVESGGTAAVAGLTDSRTQSLDSRVPGASGVPLLGKAFQHTASNTGSKQVAVFVTATLVEDTQAGTRRMADARRYIPPVDVETFRQALRESLERLDRERRTP